MCRETEGRELSRPTVENGVLHCIQDSKLGIFYVAYLASDSEQKPIGSTMVTYEWSPRYGGLIHWIMSVYVIPDMRQKGVFRALYNHVVDNAKSDEKVKCVRLYVETDNDRAI